MDSLKNVGAWLGQLVQKAPVPRSRSWSDFRRRSPVDGSGYKSAPDSYSTLGKNFQHLDNLWKICNFSFGGVAAENAGGRKDSTASDISRAFEEFKNENRDESDGELSVSKSDNFLRYKQKKKTSVQNQDSVLSADSGLFLEHDKVQGLSLQTKMSPADERFGRQISQETTFSVCTSAMRNIKIPEEESIELISKYSAGNKQTQTKVAKQDCKKPYKHSLTENKKKGVIKLSLQYFEQSNQLRVILMTGRQLPIRNGPSKMKLFIDDDSCSQVHTTCRKTVSNHDINFGEIVYIHTDDVCKNRALILKLFKISRIFGRKKCIGQASVPLDQLEINLDTTVEITLTKTLESRSEDIKVVKQDQSILAQTSAFITSSDMNALTPQMHRRTRSATLSGCRQSAFMSDKRHSLHGRINTSLLYTTNAHT